MQKVSKTYKESMKSSLRERGYIMITFGIFNQEVQANASIEDNDFSYFSNKSNVLSDKSEDNVYATLEENFTKVDGSMYFLPRNTTGVEYLDCGIVSSDLVSNNPFSLTINLNLIETDFKGLTVNFGENYPVDFDIVSGTGQTIEFRDNTESYWTTEEVLDATSSLTFVFYTMKNPQSRLRIYSILFGYGLVYYNDSVVNSSLESYISPISADIPQIDFTLELKNYDKYFNVDNPNSAINYLETGQEMDIMYGYQLPDSDEIEWIQGNHLLCSEWESDDTTATIKCQDIFRNMESEYIKGIYSSEGMSYYDLAVSILEDAGIEDYYIDPRLKSLYTNNPIPRVEHKEALQIIANACRCILIQTRYGQIQIRSNYMPSATASSNGETEFSHVESITEETDKDEYATLATNYSTVNGAMYFIPKDASTTLNTGYISSEISDENGEFESNPKVTLTLEAVRTYYGIDFVFGNALPAEFIIRAYNEGVLVNEFTVNEDISTETHVAENIDDCNVIEIEFTKTAEPYNRIVLNYIAMSDIADFTMTRRDMTSYPIATKQEKVKELTVVCYTYQENSKADNLICEDVDTVEGEEITYYLTDPSYSYSVTLDETEGLVDIVDWGNYFITLRYKVTGSYRLDVAGYTYKVIEKYVTKTLRSKGTTVKWENPLISNLTMAEDLAEWLVDYYESGIEYEYDTRGNPELDANDTIYQENDFQDGMTVVIYRHTVNFKQAFSGKVTARRKGG